MYNPLISKAGQFLTNEGAALHAIGVPSKVFRIIMTHTYEKDIPERDRHHRVMLTLESTLLNLPAEMPDLEQPHYAERYTTMRRLAEEYRNTPWKCGILEYRVPIATLRQLAPHLLADHAETNVIPFFLPKRAEYEDLNQAA
jgi:hypothetical protein